MKSLSAELQKTIRPTITEGTCMGRIWGNVWELFVPEPSAFTIIPVHYITGYDINILGMSPSLEAVYKDYM